MNIKTNTDEGGMRGLMMDRPLIISGILTHCERVYGHREVVSRRFDGGLHRYDYTASAARMRKLGSALIGLGVKRGDRVATFAQNHHVHLELYYAISGIGAICHTINPRFTHSDIGYVIEHAEDCLIFFDCVFEETLARALQNVSQTPKLIRISDGLGVDEPTKLSAMGYEELIEASDEIEIWPEFDENLASGLCYTSGTTGKPKGVLYSHRATVLHTLVLSMANNFALTAADTVLPLVPMYHVNAWGIPFSALLTGADLIFPGHFLDPASLYELIEQEGVTVVAGVPTICGALLAYVTENNLGFSSLKTIITGGAAASKALIKGFRSEYNLDVIHGWGMTETPSGTTGRIVGRDLDLPVDDLAHMQTAQGLPLFGVDMRLRDDNGNIVEQQGQAGHLEIRGPWVCKTYYRQDISLSHSCDGWLKTGDIALFDERGAMRITDRSKDVIKSGGEWISSIEIEDAAMSCRGVSMAAAIAVAHYKWQERPLLVVVPENGAVISETALREEMLQKLEKWQMPDIIEFANSLPLGATGKVNKLALRDIYGDFPISGPEG